MVNQLGVYPGLPFTPNALPIGWIFEGTSAYGSLCKLLSRIGCEVQAALTNAVGSQFSIVQTGAADTAADALLAAADALNVKLHDAEFQSIVRGKISYGELRADGV